MPRRKARSNLQGLLDELAEAGAGREISVKQLRDAIGRRSFAPLLLLVSLLGFTPLGMIPGGPTILAIMIILIGGQVALGRQSVWMPGKLLEVRVEGKKLKNAAAKLKPFARVVDKLIRPRLAALTEPPYSAFLGLICVLVALTVPPLELVPLVDMPLWAAMVALSLALFAHDGLLAIVAFALTAVGLYLSFSALFWGA